MRTENGDVIISQDPTDMLEQARTYVQWVQQANAPEEEMYSCSHPRLSPRQTQRGTPGFS